MGVSVCGCAVDSMFFLNFPYAGLGLGGFCLAVSLPVEVDGWLLMKVIGSRKCSELCSGGFESEEEFVTTVLL